MVLPFRGRGLFGAPTRNGVSYGESGGMSRPNEARACRRPHSVATSLPNARAKRDNSSAERTADTTIWPQSIAFFLHAYIFYTKKFGHVKKKL